MVSKNILQKLGLSLAMCALIGPNTMDLYGDEVADTNVEFEKIEQEVIASTSAQESGEQGFFAAKLACVIGLFGSARAFLGGLCSKASDKVANGLEKIGLKKEINGYYLHTWVVSIAGALGIKALAQKKEQLEDEKNLNSGVLSQDAVVARNVVLKSMIDEYHAKVATYKNSLLHNTKGVNVTELKEYTDSLKRDVITLYHAHQSYWERIVSFFHAICPWCSDKEVASTS